MITELKVSNFKTHRSTRIEMSALTLLTGMNSAGKTSLVQALLLLRQSFFNNRLLSGVELNESLCRIGTVNDALYRFAETGIMSFEFLDGQSYRFDYNAGDELGGTFVKKAFYSESVANEHLSKLSLFNDNFQYVSSMRWAGISHFERYDYEAAEHGQISCKLGQGEAVAHYLHLNGGNDAFDYMGMSGETTVAEQVLEWERSISSNITIDVQKGVTGGFDILYGYRLPNVKPIAELRAENVGFGISHSLPVITALVSAKPGSLIVLENPEAHLHPMGQSQLAKLIARVAQRGVQVIVETHSDHIINGILLASKIFEDRSDGKKNCGIDRKNIRIYYIEKDERTQTFAVAHPIKVEGRGRIDFQPKGFFDQAEQDLYQINGF